VQAHLEMVVAKEAPVVGRVVVCHVHVVIDDEAVRDHEVVWLVARRGILAVRGQRP
jgi:hypothetical protein